jgi:hypothetical protein
MLVCLALLTARKPSRKHALDSTHAFAGDDSIISLQILGCLCEATLEICSKQHMVVMRMAQQLRTSYNCRMLNQIHVTHCRKNSYLFRAVPLQLLDCLEDLSSCAFIIPYYNFLL